MHNMNKPLIIVITGPTATGKTRLAAKTAAMLDGEVISADSRQVYRGMDIGTGKDLSDFNVDGRMIPYHLVDIADPGEEYNVFAFQKDFLRSYNDIIRRNKQVILCGGTGLYVEAAISRYRLPDVPENRMLRHRLDKMTMAELAAMFGKIRQPHNTTDTTDRDRLVRAIEISLYEREHQDMLYDYPDFDIMIFALAFEREQLRQRITERLNKRLDQGMIDEVRRLLDAGVEAEQLMFYGLEYRYLTMFVTGQLTYNSMFSKLNTAIHQFAKRQMTWYRRMERKGFHIHWVDGQQSLDEQACELLKVLS